MQKTGVLPLAWEDPLKKETAIHFSVLAWEIPWTEEPDGCSPWGHKESDRTERLTLRVRVGVRIEATGSRP